MRFCISLRDGDGVKKVADFIKDSLLQKGLVYDEINPDLVVSVGGDGTFLRAIQKYFSIRPLFANINFGNLGYLCEYTDKELTEFVSDLLRPHHEEKEIALLEAKYDGKTCYALNEFRVESSKGDTLIFDVFINDTYLETLKADGCLISTSIGSSAMARSLGGAIVDNEIEMIQFVEKAPIQNRTYESIRSPFVLQKDKVIKIENIKNNEFFIYYDSKSDFVKNYYDDIVIRLSDKKVRVLKNTRNNYIKKTHEAFIYDRS